MEEDIKSSTDDMGEDDIVDDTQFNEVQQLTRELNEYDLNQPILDKDNSLSQAEEEFLPGRILQPPPEKSPKVQVKLQ